MAPKECDICGRLVETTHMLKYPYHDFQDIVAAGFTPDEATLKKLPRPHGESTLMPLLVWKHGQVPGSTTDWWLCSQCSSRTLPFRGKARRAKGHTIDEAKQAAAAALSQSAQQDCYVIFDIIADVRIGSARGEGMSKTEAEEDAKRSIPMEAFGVTEPRAIRGFTQNTQKYEAYSESEAHESARADALVKGVRLGKVICESEPKRGILGSGRKPGIWSTEHIRPMAVELDYRLPAEVRAIAMPKSTSLIEQLRQYESRLVDLLSEVTKIAEEDKSEFARVSKREDFLVKMMSESIQSGLEPAAIFSAFPMSWPNHVNRELDWVRQQISTCTQAG